MSTLRGVDLTQVTQHIVAYHMVPRSVICANLKEKLSPSPSADADGLCNSIPTHILGGTGFLHKVARPTPREQLRKRAEVAEVSA